jgi:hypothetical protein
MKTFTYWVAESNDHPCYSIVGRTKRECVERIENSGVPYGPVHRREIQYTDTFDLFDLLTGEGGGRLAGTKT